MKILHTAIKAALAQEQEPWCMKMNGCKTKCEDCPVEVVEQEPVNAWLIFGKDNEPLIVSSDWVITKKYKEAGRRVEQLAYYTTPPQQEQ
jgi:(2Fe-2S) ferredoxin